MTLPYRKKGETIFGDGNSPLTAGTVTFYIEGTTTLLDTYADADLTTPNDNPITLNGDGDFPVSVYLGTASNYKEVIESSDSSITSTIDNIPKTVTSGVNLLQQSPSWTWSTVSASTFTLDENDVGNAYNADTESNDVTIYLPDPNDVGNGPTLAFEKGHASNDLIVLTHTGAAFKTIENDGDGFIVSSDATEWHIVADYNSTQGASIGDGSITNAKLADMASSSFKGRVTAGTGAPEDLSTAQATALIEVFQADNDTDTAGVKGLVPAPSIGDASAQKVLAADGTWIAGGGGGVASINPATGGLVGVNATADTTNRLSVSSPATLFDNEGDDHQLKINKDAAGDNASVIFQTGYSGRAEFGLTGDDDFHMKVSPDGSTFYDGIIIDKDTGEVSFPNSSISGDEWGDAVDDDIIPDADGTRNLGADATRFAGGYVDNLYLTNGYRETGSIVIADDAVGEIDTPADGGFVLIGANFYSEFTQSSMSSLLLYDAGSSLQTVEIWAGSLITIVNDASSYTGTTGTDGNITIGCGTDKIIIENRTGGGRTFHYTFIGHPS